MPISVVVGGQYGSEGKGKLAHWLAAEQNAAFAIRVGGANSGHTAVTDRGVLALRQLPTASVFGHVKCVLPAGAYIDKAVLLQEVEELKLERNRLLIHANAVIVEDWMKNAERESNLVARIGSTGQGVGSAVASRVLRSDKVTFAKDVPELSQYVDERLQDKLSDALINGERVIIEGTQGFGLSLLHGGHYPFATSRDTSAAGFLSESGLSPLDVDYILMVIRAFPIRVAGASGPLINETTWESVSARSNAGKSLQERTTVTSKIRRVAEFDAELVRRALTVNRPTHICLNHVDYFDYSLNEKEWLNDDAALRVMEIEAAIGQSIDYVGLGRKSLIRRPAKGWRHFAAA